QPATILQKSANVCKDLHEKGEIDLDTYLESLDLLSNFEKSNVFLMVSTEVQVLWLRKQIGLRTDIYFILVCNSC
ncbi:hypothetical protein QML37_30715, partial [Klebsiella pneumoniae]|uniref:hypothetical protein n=1 Tax=Klebsiella pneumoniae TaxID=573 RepID=UPI003A804B01